MKAALFLTLILSFFANAEISVDSLHRNDVSFEVSNARIKMYKYSHPDRVSNGKPILLAHGFVSNLHIFDALIPQLVELGYDVYALNFRGHGNAQEKSTVVDYKEGDYGFKKMVSEDIVGATRKIYSLTQQETTVICHSMGGMITKAALSLGLLKGLVSSVVSFGSPPHVDYQRFDPGSIQYRAMMIPSLEMRSGDMLFDPKQVMAGFDFLNRFNLFYRASKFILGPFITEAERGMIINQNLISPQDDFIKKAFSLAPVDIHKDMMNFARFGFDFKEAPVSVPVLDIMGDQDGLAPYKLNLKSTPIQAEQKGYWFLILPGVSHIDLMATRAVKSILPSLQKFVTQPSSLGLKNRTLISINIFSTSSTNYVCQKFYQK